MKFALQISDQLNLDLSIQFLSKYIFHQADKQLFNHILKMKGRASHKQARNLTQSIVAACKKCVDPTKFLSQSVDGY